MKIYRIPERTRTIIFDIDSTLYTDSVYAFEQVDCQVRYFADLRGIPAEEARKMVAAYRKKWAELHGGQKISLGNTLAAFGIPIETSVEWRKKLLEPKNFLSYNGKLVSALQALAGRFRLICVTNNPVLPARKTLDVIGVSALIPDIIGLDTCFKSKPAAEPFLLAAEKTSARPDECLAVGDRYDLDVALPLELGMGGILVSGVEDVYTLNSVI